MKMNELKAALDGHTQLGGKIASLQTLQEKCSNALVGLEDEASLEDQNALEKIGRLRIQSDLLPSRIAALEEARETSRLQLLTGAEEFGEAVLRPKIKTLRVAAVEKARGQLAGLYSGDKLVHAINQSAIVLSLDQISAGLQRDPDPASPREYVTRRMAVLDQLQKIEKTI